MQLAKVVLNAILVLMSKTQGIAPMAISSQDTVRSAMIITIFQMMAVMPAEMLLVAITDWIGDNNVMMVIQMTEINVLQTAALFVEMASSMGLNNAKTEMTIKRMNALIV